MALTDTVLNARIVRSNRDNGMGFILLLMHGTGGKRRMNDLVWIVFCHLIGDYVLQSDFIARTKGKNWYHLIVHCALYCVPFVIVFGLTWHIGFIFVSHVIVDSLKAKWDILTYCEDQFIHYIILLCMLCV
jgi:hypothetical protein